MEFWWQPEGSIWKSAAEKENVKEVEKNRFPNPFVDRVRPKVGPLLFNSLFVYKWAVWPD